MPIADSLLVLSAGHATPADARALLAELHAQTLARVAEHARTARKSSAPLDPKPHEYAAWAPGQPTGQTVHVTARAGGRLACDALDAAWGFCRKGVAASTHSSLGGAQHAPDADLAALFPELADELLLPIAVDHPSWHTGDPDGRGPLPDFNRRNLGVDLASPGPIEYHAGRWYRAGTVARPGHPEEQRFMASRDRASGQWTYSAEPALLLPDGTPWPAWAVLDCGALPAGFAAPYGHRHWHLCSPAQILCLALWLRACQLAFSSTLDPGRIVRHADLMPRGRCDPGPSVPLEALRAWACSSEDLLQAIGAAQGYGWARWILEQWARPQGLIVRGVDDVIPGRTIPVAQMAQADGAAAQMAQADGAAAQREV